MQEVVVALGPSPPQPVGRLSHGVSLPTRWDTASPRSAVASDWSVGLREWVVLVALG